VNAVLRHVQLDNQLCSDSTAAVVFAPVPSGEDPTELGAEPFIHVTAVEELSSDGVSTAGSDSSLATTSHSSVRVRTLAHVAVGVKPCLLQLDGSLLRNYLNLATQVRARLAELSSLVHTPARLLRAHRSMTLHHRQNPAADLTNLHVGVDDMLASTLRSWDAETARRSRNPASLWLIRSLTMPGVVLYLSFKLAAPHNSPTDVSSARAQASSLVGSSAASSATGSTASVPTWLGGETGRADVGGDPLGALLQSFGAAALAQIDHARASFASAQWNPFSGSTEDLIRAVSGHYRAQLSAQLPSLLGSAAVLGNPVGLINSMRTGVYDLFNEPTKGIAQVSPLC